MHHLTSQTPLFETEITYVVPGQKAVFYASERHKSYWPVESHQVPMFDMRPVADQLSFDRNGFMLVDRPSAVRDFSDQRQVTEIYHPEIEALVQFLTGAEKVILFGTIVRSDATATADSALPSFGAHIDYGERTVRQFSEDILGKAEARHWLKRRHMLINLWRPIRPVERSPLALCDASTVAAADLNESEIRGGLGDPDRPSMFGFNLQHNPAHRWYYAPHQQPHEILAFKLFDSDADATQWTGHSAFRDPTAPADARPRESIEIRTISFMPED